MRYAKKGIVLLLALVLVGGLVACGDDSDEGTSDKPSVETIVVRNGEPVDGITELEYDAGEQVRFRVSSDKADEVHVHGYDVEEEVPAGGTADFSFPADIEGIFEVELHGSEKQIAELRVNP
jgi:hypothetical protein